MSALTTTNGVSKTLANQKTLPKLPVPALEDTLNKYLRALSGLQTEEEHERTKLAVQKFKEDPEQGPRLQAALEHYNEGVNSYIEEFWYESYLGQTESVVLSLNPFFVLEDDPTPSRGSQLPRAASLILSSLGFIHDYRAGILEPDAVRGVGLDMDQYSRLFGTSRIPTSRGCKMETSEESRHVVVIRRGQFYWFDALDTQNRPTMTEREIVSNLRAICEEADKTPINEVAKGAVGVLSTENRRVWSKLRATLTNDKHNASCLRVVDSALFIVCLDDVSPQNAKELCGNLLCGTYELNAGIQVGTCTNRWYDKLQIIVCANGEAGINFEHTGVDGHTVLRYAADVYTELVLLFAKSINASAPTLFKAKLSPHAKSYKAKPNDPKEPEEPVDTVPKKLTWTLTPEIRTGIRFAETRLSDLICQNDIEALEFKGYGKEFITKHGFSPDAYVQMAYQAAYYSLYGRIESTYEPAMTKAFLHGRTEAIRTVQPASVEFVKTFVSSAKPADKINALRKACKNHTELTRECSKGLGQDRHLYALYCLFQREINGDASSHANSDEEGANTGRPASPALTSSSASRPSLPDLFADPGYSLLSTSVLSTSNCGNPALRLFGFGPVCPEGFGIGYIIKDDGVSIVAASKHLQTRRFLDTLQAVFLETQRMIRQLYADANRGIGEFIDHASVLREEDTLVEEAEGLDGVAEESLEGYGFYDELERSVSRDRRRRVGINIQIRE